MYPFLERGGEKSEEESGNSIDCYLYGGSVLDRMTVNLEPNQKLEEVTWKDNSLWYLTRPMTDEDVAETHSFQQQTDLGVFEGTVTIVESKE